MTAVWRQHGTEWQLMAPVGFDDEAALHKLVEEAPQMLPLAGAPQLVVLGTEVQLGNGYADLVAIEPDGRPVVIEIKLGKNAEARRAVVAQALAYAAYLNLLDPATFERSVLGKHLSARGWPSLEAALQSADQEGSFDPATFRRGLDDAFARGAFRIVFVLDQAPSELVRLVGYLELIAERVQIDLVTVEAYEVEGSRVLLPQRVDPERRPTADLPIWPPVVTRAGSTRAQPVAGIDLFDAGIAASPEEQRPALTAIRDWARSLEARGLARLFSLQGVEREVLHPRLTNEDVGLVTLWNENGAAIQLWRSVLDRRAPKTLAKLDDVLPAPIGAGTTTRDACPELLALLTEACEEAANVATQGFD